MTHYFVAEAETADRLREEVDDLLTDGWVCQGGVSMAAYVRTDRYNAEELTVYYAQAMVKESH